MSSTASRRSFLKQMGLGLATATLPAMRPASAATRTVGSAKRPNIVFVLADDQRADMMACAGNPYLKTPNFDRLASEGLRFRNAFVNSGVCSPSRGAFLTGKHPHQCGTPTIITMSNTFHRNETPFPARLHEAGYKVGHFGKWHLGEGQVPKPGYDHWVGFYALSPFHNPKLTINGTRKSFEGYTDDILAELAADYIKNAARADQPFCVYVALCAPHLPFGYPERHEHAFDGVDIPKPDSYNEDFDKTGKAPRIRDSFIRIDKFRGGLPLFDNSWEKYIKSYYRSCLGLDDAVGTLLRALDDAGVAEDTLFVYSSDQGYSLGEHGLTEKHYSYEHVMRVPMLVRYPRMIAPDTVRDELVSSMDVAPTVFDLAGVPIPEDVMGMSWRPLFEADQEPVRPWREDLMFFLEGLHLTVRTDRHKLITYPADPERELYDLARDPEEMNNLIDDAAYAGVLADLERRLERHKRETGLTDRVDAEVESFFLLGPFAAGDQEAVAHAALAKPLSEDAEVGVGEQTFRWQRVRNEVAAAGIRLDGAKWIWLPGTDATTRAPLGTAFFRRGISLPKRGIRRAFLAVTADNEYTAWINDQRIEGDVLWNHVAVHEVTAHLRPGANVLVASASNEGKEANPAGLLAMLRVEFDNGEIIESATDKAWRCAAKEETGWRRLDFDDSAWHAAQEVGVYGCVPWRRPGMGAVPLTEIMPADAGRMFLAAFPIEVTAERDPFVRVHIRPMNGPIAGYANGECLYHRKPQGQNDAFNVNFNPPLSPGLNTVAFAGRIEDFPFLAMRVATWKGKTRLPTDGF